MVLWDMGGDGPENPFHIYNTHDLTLLACWNTLFRPSTLVGPVTWRDFGCCLPVLPSRQIVSVLLQSTDMVWCCNMLYSSWFVCFGIQRETIRGSTHCHTHVPYFNLTGHIDNATLSCLQHCCCHSTAYSWEVHSCCSMLLSCFLILFKYIYKMISDPQPIAVINVLVCFPCAHVHCTVPQWGCVIGMKRGFQMLKSSQFCICVFFCVYQLYFRVEPGHGMLDTLPLMFDMTLNLS